jgi:4-hydroxybenzoate polyprenyltransferase
MRSSTTFSYILSISIGLLAWKLLATAVASSVLPSPEAAFGAFFESCKTTAFWKNFGISAYRVVISILIAWSLAFPIGVFVGYSKRLDKVVSPMIFMTYPIPKIVFLPVILLMFGLGDFSKITIISIILFFQILVATRDGVQAIDEKYFDSLLSMGATDVDILREVVFPAALPHSFTALRITTGTAISVLFFVESFATASGLGYMIMDSWAKVAYTQIFVGIIGMSILGVILYETLSYLEKRICPWQYTETENDNEEELSFSGPFIKMAVYLRMIKFSHTIFALPFALAALVLVNRVSPITLHAVFWIIMAMVGARSAAMGFNRFADASIDSKNPRTAVRAIPSGAISKTDAGLFIMVSSILFIYSSMMLSWLCFWLSFPVLCILFCYSYTKRFTWLSHIILGFSISLVPMAVWVAVAGTFSIKIAMLCFVLLSYISGFDILYACQDTEFDREERLYSIPAVFGIKKALAASSLLHIISFLSLVSLYWIFSLSPVFLIFALVIAVLFVVEHKLVRPDDLTRVNVAFYHINSIISVLLFVAILSGEWLRSM